MAVPAVVCSRLAVVAVSGVGTQGGNCDVSLTHAKGIRRTDVKFGLKVGQLGPQMGQILGLFKDPFQ